MKRYKQSILSNFFLTRDDSDVHHLVEANLDIESRSDRTLCTEVLHGECRYEVLVNQHLPGVCLICSAILDRRISNMPIERKNHPVREELVAESPPESQLSLGLSPSVHPAVNENTSEGLKEKQPEQFELLI